MKTTLRKCCALAFAQNLAPITKGWRIKLFPSTVGKTARTLLLCTRETTVLHCSTYKFKGKLLITYPEILSQACPNDPSLWAFILLRSRKCDDFTNVLNCSQSIFCVHFFDAPFRILSVWSRDFYRFSLLFSFSAKTLFAGFVSL